MIVGREGNGVGLLDGTVITAPFRYPTTPPVLTHGPAPDNSSGRCIGPPRRARRDDSTHSTIRYPIRISCWAPGRLSEPIAVPPESTARLSRPSKNGAVAVFLTDLRRELQQGMYHPAPARRVDIPKASGGVRHLDIPRIRDRVVEQAAHMVLLPIFEADFLPCSYGFRGPPPACLP
jgi:hypothetical protein